MISVNLQAGQFCAITLFNTLPFEVTWRISDLNDAYIHNRSIGTN